MQVMLKAVENLTFSSNSCYSFVDNTKISTLPNLEEIKHWNSKIEQIVMIPLFFPFPRSTDLVPLKSSAKDRSQGFDPPLPDPKSTFTTQESPLDEQTHSAPQNSSNSPWSWSLTNSCSSLGCVWGHRPSAAALLLPRSPDPSTHPSSFHTSQLPPHSPVVPHSPTQSW